MFKSVKSLDFFQGWQVTSILKEPLRVPDPAHQFETIALDSRVLNSLRLCNPSVLTTWVPRREITSISVAYFKSLGLLSLRILFGEY